MSQLNFYFGPAVPQQLESLGLSFIASPALTAHSAIANLSAKRYALENYAHIDQTINYFTNLGINTSVPYTVTIPATTWNGTFSPVGAVSYAQTYVSNSSNMGFPFLNSPIEVVGLQITMANTWHPTIQPGLIWRSYTVPATDPSSSWILRAGVSAGDNVILVYSVPEVAYTSFTSETLTYPNCSQKYRTIKERASPTTPTTFNFQGDLYALIEVRVNNVVPYSDSLFFTGTESHSYVLGLNQTTKTITVGQALGPDDFIEITYLSYNDFYPYAGYRDYFGFWYPFDMNPESGHYISDDKTGALTPTYIALKTNSAIIYAIPTACLTYNLAGGSINFTFLRGTEWGETHFIRHTINDNGNLEAVVTSQNSSTSSSWGYANFGANYYDQIDSTLENIYSTDIPTMLPLGKVLISGAYSPNSVAVADIRQRGGGVPTDFPMVAVTTQSSGLDTLRGFYDLGIWDGAAYKDGGVVQINIDPSVLKSDPNDPNPNTFTNYEIYNIVKSQIPPGIDFVINYTQT